MPNSDRDLQDSHNRGQRDGARNHHDPGTPGEIYRFFSREEEVRDLEELDAKYNEGWSNGYKDYP